MCTLQWVQEQYFLTVRSLSFLTLNFWSCNIFTLHYIHEYQTAFVTLSAFHVKYLSNFTITMKEIAHRTFIVALPRFAIVSCLLCFVRHILFQISFTSIKPEQRFTLCNACIFMLTFLSYFIIVDSLLLPFFIKDE